MFCVALTLPHLLETVTREIMSDRLRGIFEETGGADFAYSIPGQGRFRVNVFRQRGSVSLAARRVNTHIPTFEELLLPPVVERVCAFPDGMVLVVGMTGSGKSSTLAAIINQINRTEPVHILTIEDPIEYVYRDDKAFVNQREVGLDVPDFHTAMRYAVREDPDVILIGELRDAITVETAVSASETGHLVFSTIHSVSAAQTVARILEFFPPDRLLSVRHLLAAVLRAVFAQRLVKGVKPERPRVPAVEIMYVNGPIRKRIMDGEDDEIISEMRAYAKDGMQDFNMSLYRLVKDGWATEADALIVSPNPDQLKMQFRGMVLNVDAQSM